MFARSRRPLLVRPNIRNSQKLYYIGRTAAESTLMEVPMQADSVLRAGTPRAITPFPYLVSGPARSHDAAADGQRFVVTTYDPPPGKAVAELQVIVNWR